MFEVLREIIYRMLKTLGKFNTSKGFSLPDKALCREQGIYC